MKLSKNAEFMLSRFKEKNTQSSWDWDEDKKLAEFLCHPDLEIIDHALRSSAPSPCIVDVWKATWYKTVTKKRISALGELVKNGLVRAGWVGMGHGGKSSFGVGRVRAWAILTT